MKKRNVKTVNVTLTEPGLNLVKRTPALRDLFRKDVLDNLQVGVNEVKVNHFWFGKMMNLLNSVNPFAKEQHTKCEEIK